MDTAEYDGALLYLGIGTLCSGLAIHKIITNKLKIQHVSLSAVEALLLLEGFCYFLLPVTLGVSVFFMACALYYIKLPVREMLPARGKSILITGCDCGLGHALAKHFDKQGLQVFAGVLDKNGSGAEELKNACSQNLSLIQLDVTNSEEIEAAYREISERVKDTGLWAVLNNAGVLIYVADSELLPMDVYKKCMEVNFYAVVHITKVFLPLLRKAKGRLITMSSTAGLNPIPGFAAYGASKAAVTMFGAVMRQDLLKWGVKVSSIHPTGFKSNIFGTLEHRSSQAQILLENIKPDVRDDYGDDYLNALQDVHHDLSKATASDVTPVLEDGYHAVLAKNPYITYNPGTFAYVFPSVFHYFPMSVYDAFSKLVFLNHRIMLPRSLRTSHNNSKTD